MSITDLRLQPKMNTPTEIAVLAKCLPIEKAAELIDLYARQAVAAAELEATLDRLSDALREPSDV